MRKRKAGLILCAALITASLMAACSSPALDDGASGMVSEPDAALPRITLTDGMELAKTDRLQLVYRKGQIQVVDVKRETSWPTTVTEEQYDGKLNQLWSTTAASLVVINYAANAQSAQIQSTNPGLAGASETCFQLDNGLKIVYDFTDLKIKLALELKLDGGQLVARLPAADVTEYGDALLTSVEIMPFFGCAGENEDGYFVYPDGSGAIFEFDQLKNKKNVSRQYKWQLYGNEASYLESSVFAMTRAGRFFLPVYGVKKGGAGFAAVITEGAEDAGINLYASAVAVRLNRICPEFTYRYAYSVDVNTLRQGGSKTQTEITEIQKSAILYDREVRYLFLDGGADYSDMAGAVREFYRKTGVLRQMSKDAVLPLGVDFLVGIQKNSLFSEYVGMTSFEQCEEIMNALLEKGIPALQVTLEGWEKDGYGRFPAKYQADARAGGKAGLSHLAQQAKNSGVSLYLNVNFLDAYKDVGNFSNRTDLIRNPRNIIIKNRDSDRYLLRPAIAAKKLEQVLESIPDGVTGLSFEGFGNTLFSDYSKSGAVSRNETARVWQSMLDASAKALGGAGVYGGNFITQSSGRLYEIPYEHSGFTIADRSIPFFHMIVHGSKAYSAQPINLFHDEQTQILKLMEYGYMPYYKWTEKSSSELKDTGYSGLFSSQYRDYLERAVQVYGRFSSLMGDCWTANMVSHDLVAEGVYRVRYDNGAALYFNYTSKDVHVEGVTVPAMDAARKSASFKEG